MMCAIKKAGVLSILLVVVLLAVAVIAEAQQPAKIPRIGYVSGTGDATNQGPYVEALRQGWRGLGHAEATPFVIDYPAGGGKVGLAPSLIAEPGDLRGDL